MRPSPRWLLPCLLVIAPSACESPAPGVARGEAVFDACAPCHGPAGEGIAELAAPPLGGAPSWYVESQLEKFHNGYRGYHHLDAGGLRMKPMRRILTSDDEVQSVIGYVATLPAANPAPTGIGDPAGGQQDYLVCAGCHGPDGAGNEQLGSPSLQHLPDWYIELSLQKYRDGLRGYAPGDSLGMVMAVNVVDMEDERIADLAAYIQTLGPGGIPFQGGGPMIVAAPDIVFDEADLPEGVTGEMVAQGKDIFNGSQGICFSCHMPGGVGGPVAPNLGDDEWLNVDGSYPEIVNIIISGVAEPRQYPGVMLPRANMPLTDAQVDAVAAYVYMLSRAGG